MQIISRSEAKQQNLKHYFTGKPCKYGHVAERKVANSNCSVCNKDIVSRFYVNNRDKVKNKSKEYYSDNSDKIKKYQKEYNKINKDKINNRHQERYDSEPDYKMKFRLRGILSKVLKRTDTVKDLKSHAILGYNCIDLRRHLEDSFVDGMSWDNYGEWHIDHIVPIKVLLDYGVTDVAFINGLDNLQPLWAEDNLKKGDWSNLST
jgi:hypothetical protein